MTPTVHLWGLDEKPSVVSPESVAIYWLLNSKLCGKEACVVFSNNTDLSPNQELPVLIEGNQTIHGFANIAEYLFPQESALEMALLQFAQTKINTLTQYQLYLNKNNYDRFTRKVFSYLLHWPMWYNTPIKYRSLARKRCETLGYLSHEDDEEEHSVEYDDLVQSKAIKVTQNSKVQNKELLTSTRYNVQFLSRLGEQLKWWLEARKKIPKDKIPADYLLWANLFVQQELPDGRVVRDFLEQNLGPDAYRNIQEHLHECTQLEPVVAIRQPTFTESGNIVTSVYRQAIRYV